MKTCFHSLISISRLKLLKIMQLHMHIMNLIWCVLTSNLSNGYAIYETKQSMMICLLLLKIWRVWNNNMYRERMNYTTNFAPGNITQKSDLYSRFLFCLPFTKYVVFVENCLWLMLDDKLILLLFISYVDLTKFSKYQSN